MGYLRAESPSHMKQFAAKKASAPLTSFYAGKLMVLPLLLNLSVKGGAASCLTQKTDSRARSSVPWVFRSGLHIEVSLGCVVLLRLAGSTMSGDVVLGRSKRG